MLIGHIKPISPAFTNKISTIESILKARHRSMTFRIHVVASTCLNLYAAIHMGIIRLV
ncbi:uncharacterized protein EV154DRAFT_547689 [Mucor mucedo]|uniref:uncharacterized protein n=1 Tax=Mucor mucedo TaxID=29922 RepID=UPI002220FEF2|nr:uncharacterized protein EV154DRAFT_547689 [Mucor mucedo]KAI7896018.1 hypothetical protein EV154DRAFT_547689 [Mucor mucedo]